jgi:hypothetical protein
VGRNRGDGNRRVPGLGTKFMLDGTTAVAFSC